MTIGERLKKIRGEISRERFSPIIGISKNTLVNYEKGVNPPPADVLERILNHRKDINPAWLVVGEGPMLRDGGGDVREAQGEYCRIEPGRCEHPIHTKPYPDELVPELLLDVSEVIDAEIAKRQATISPKKVIDITMLVYADAYWRGRNIRREFVEKLIELTI